jgi:hypothetical protein
VTAYVQTTLTPQTLRIEQALAVANQALLSACRFSRSARATVVTCADGALMAGSSDLARTLAQEASLLRASSQEMIVAVLPPLAPPAPTYLALAQEDLVLTGAGLSSLLAESAGAVPYAVAGPPPPIYVNYGPRALQLVQAVRRAEAWLEDADHATGAHVTLPGFTPGAPSLESQVALQ